MREKDFQTTFNKWLKTEYKKMAVFELKITKIGSIPFSAVVPHQIEGLWHAKHGVIAYKIPDVGYQTPFDCMCLAGIPAYVVIKYPDFFCLVDIDKWIAEEKVSIRRSLTKERADELSTVTILA